MKRDAAEGIGSVEQRVELLGKLVGKDDAGRYSVRIGWKGQLVNQLLELKVEHLENEGTPAERWVDCTVLVSRTCDRIWSLDLSGQARLDTSAEGITVFGIIGPADAVRELAESFRCRDELAYEIAESAETLVARHAGEEPQPVKFQVAL